MDIGWPEITLNGSFCRKTHDFCEKSLRELSQFKAFFNQLAQQPIVKATLKSEVSRLNDLKNSEYHRAKIKQILHDYHNCVEENLRLKENNQKLLVTKRHLESKLDIASKKIQQVQTLNTNPATLNKMRTGLESPFSAATRNTLQPTSPGLKSDHDHHDPSA